jgi:hypothetical protein
MSEPGGEVRALVRDHENLEGAHAYLAELLTSGAMKGLLIVEVAKDGELGWSRFGDVTHSDMALVAAMMSHRAGVHALRDGVR